MLTKYRALGIFCSFILPILSACSSSASSSKNNDIDSGTKPEDSPTQDAAVNDAEATSFDAPPLSSGVSTLAGWSNNGLVDGPRNTALFNNPVNTRQGPDGNIYVADFDNSAIRRTTPEGTTTTLFVRDGFHRPFGLTFGNDGSLYVQTDSNDQGDNDKTTGTLWRINAGDSSAEVLLRDLGRPRGLATLPDGRLVLADITRNDLRLFDPSNNSLAPLAGANGEAGMQDAIGGEAKFNLPYDVAIIAGPTIIVSDRNNHRIRSVTLDGTVTTLAGTGEIGNKDGDALSATFDSPQGLAADAAGNIYVSDVKALILRKITPDGQVSTIAGSGTEGFADSTDPRQAVFFAMEGLDCSPDGTFIFVADGNRGDPDPYHRIRRIEQ